MHALKHKCGTNESDIKLMLRSGSPPLPSLVAITICDLEATIKLELH